jgi:hypothetical protein
MLDIVVGFEALKEVTVNSMIFCDLRRAVHFYQTTRRHIQKITISIKYHYSICIIIEDIQKYI